jgi:hypothetical protein
MSRREPLAVKKLIMILKIDVETLDFGTETKKIIFDTIILIIILHACEV